MEPQSVIDCANMCETSSIDSDIIKPINRNTVHRICSGQVVLSLAIAVKELIENAIDAGAKNVEVRLKDYGMESVEVADNGSGVRKENFPALTLKYYTSKITEFADLESVKTLGFRGEALSSLCALSKLTITTRHSSSEHGTKIEYDHNGYVVKEKPVARSPGTTVTLTDLFSPLPVRRKEYVKNHKREFSKMCNLLYAYCLVAKGVKFTCTNQTARGSPTTIVSTQGSDLVRDNIVNIFGPKQISLLIEVNLAEPDQQTAQEFGTNTSSTSPFQFEFFVSSVVHGSGRSSTDRQFYFVNSRPCEPTRLAKVVNELYRQFNPNQYPFVFLNVVAKDSLVDVNVTPDKRQVFLEKEKLLLATVKTSLTEAFKDFPSVYKMQNTSLNEGKAPKRILDTSPKIGMLDSFRKKIKQDNAASVGDDGKKPDRLSLFKPRICESKKCEQSLLLDIKDFRMTAEKKKCFGVGSDVVETVGDEKTVCKIKALPSPTKITGRTVIGDVKTNEKMLANECSDVQTLNRSSESDIADIKYDQSNTEPLNTANEVDKLEDYASNRNLIVSNCSDTKSSTPNNCADDIIDDCTKYKQSTVSDGAVNPRNKPSTTNNSKVNNCPRSKPSTVNTGSDSKSIQRGSYRKNRRSICLDLTLDDIRSSLRSRSVKNDESLQVSVKFRTQIAPTSNTAAEEELQRHIEKRDFREMRVIGQFNYAFIVTALKNDLFIIDQHATDEIYNFEELQRTTVIDSQPLVSPKQLHLTAANEIILMDNEHVFRKNGFHFTINEDEEATKKVKLTKIPVSKSYIFGKDDIEEMLYMLQEGCNDANCRPSRMRGMFASRACRKSVMVGKALSKSDMRRLVDHMGEIDKPWNCPHGRPTMRHLINLDLLQKQ